MASAGRLNRGLIEVSIFILGALFLVSGIFSWPGFTHAAGNIITYGEPTGPPLTGGISSAHDFLTATTPQLVNNLLIGERNGRLTNCTTADTSGCSHICLNADPELGTNDPDNCITGWDDLSSRGGKYLHLWQTAHNDPDVGYVRLTPMDDKNQAMGLILEASGTAPAGAFRAITQTDAQYGYLGSGDVYITRTGLAYPRAELCLNGDCIEDWNSVFPAIPSDIIPLQTGQYYVTTPGNAAVAHVTQYVNTGQVGKGSLVIGLPVGLDYPYTCGDGLCSRESNETTYSCPNDCY